MFYCPDLGRFLSRDMIRRPGKNPYTYTEDSPTAFVDSNGLESQAVTSSLVPGSEQDPDPASSGWQPLVPFGFGENVVISNALPGGPNVVTEMLPLSRYSNVFIYRRPSSQFGAVWMVLGGMAGLVGVPFVGCAQEEKKCCVRDFVFIDGSAFLADRSQLTAVIAARAIFPAEGHIGGIGPTFVVGRRGEKAVWIAGGFDLHVILTRDSSTDDCIVERTHLAGDVDWAFADGSTDGLASPGPNADGPLGAAGASGETDIERDDAAKKIYLYDAPSNVFPAFVTATLTRLRNKQSFRVSVRSKSDPENHSYVEYEFFHLYAIPRSPNPATNLVWVNASGKFINNTCGS